MHSNKLGYWYTSEINTIEMEAGISNIGCNPLLYIKVEALWATRHCFIKEKNPLTLKNMNVDLMKVFKLMSRCQTVVAHAFTSNARISVSSRPAWSTEWVLGHLELLYSRTLAQKSKKKNWCPELLGSERITQRRPTAMCAIKKNFFMISTLGWILVTPKEGHKLLLSRVRGIPERRD